MNSLLGLTTIIILGQRAKELLLGHSGFVFG